MKRCWISVGVKTSQKKKIKELVNSHSFARSLSLYQDCDTSSLPPMTQKARRDTPLPRLPHPAWTVRASGAKKHLTERYILDTPLKLCTHIYIYILIIFCQQGDTLLTYSVNHSKPQLLNVARHQNKAAHHIISHGKVIALPKKSVKPLLKDFCIDSCPRF